MTADRDLDQQLRAWFDARATQTTPDGLLERSLARAGVTSQRPGWLVKDRWLSPRMTGRPRRTWLLAVAMVAIGTGVIGASLVGDRLVAPDPAPTKPVAIVNETASPRLDPSPSDAPPSPAATPRPGALIAFIRNTEKLSSNCYDPSPTCTTPRLWIVNSDGSGAHELFPDGTGDQQVVGWSPDGTRLLYTEGRKLYLADTTGSEPQPVDTGCVAPCEGDAYAAFSGDGTRITFVRNSLDASGYSGPSAIATMDLASGRVTELSSTASGGGMHPGWSPDGRQIVFWRGGEKDMGGPVAPVKSAVFVVDADGRNLHQVSPTTVAAQSAAWSPDGSRIVFTSVEAEHQDIYTIRPDGTDPRRLTTDGISRGATWTPDGRILFIRRASDEGNDGKPGFWAMDADGANAAELIPAMMAGDEDPTWTAGPAWQPVGGPAIVPPPWTASSATPVGPPPPTPPATPAPDLSPGFTWTGTVTTALNTDAGGAGMDAAVKLRDGRVLIAQSCGTRVELYDPATGTFSPTGSMIATRGGRTMTLLRDGRVLVTGGYNCADADQAGIWASAELYDPATGTFSPTGSMRTPRSSHTATLLEDGRVLVTGGTTGERPVASGSVVLASYRTAATGASEVLASAELYDPSTGTFSKTGSMRYFRDGHTATLLHDGRVLVVGGGGEGYDSRTEVELYDPATGTFSQTGSVKRGRWLQTATLLHDGRVLVTGGRAPNGRTYAPAEVYDPATGTFNAAGSMDTGRQQHTATLLADGRVLVAGGYKSGIDGSNWDVLTSAEVYDPATQSFTPVGSMGQRRMEHTATLLDDGRVLIAGGVDITSKSGAALSSALLYQP